MNRVSDWESHTDERENEYLYHLAMQLDSENPVRRLVMQRICNLRLPRDVVDRLLKTIDHPSGHRLKEQMAAVALLGNLPLDAEEKQRCLPYFKRILNITPGKSSFWRSFTDFISPGAFRLPALRAATIRTCGKLQMEAMLHMVSFDLNTSTDSPQVRQAAAEALPPLLASLTSEHYSRVHPDTVPYLCRALKHPDSVLVMRILEALEQVEDERAVPAVEEVAYYGQTPELQRVARRILPILQERQRQENAPHMLLRASMPPEAAPDELLRPAMNTAETQPETLLRASEKRSYEERGMES